MWLAQNLPIVFAACFIILLMDRKLISSGLDIFAGGYLLYSIVTRDWTMVIIVVAIYALVEVIPEIRKKTTV